MQIHQAKKPVRTVIISQQHHTPQSSSHRISSEHTSSSSSPKASSQTPLAINEKNSIIIKDTLSLHHTEMSDSHHFSVASLPENSSTNIFFNYTSCFFAAATVCTLQIKASALWSSLLGDSVPLIRLHVAASQSHSLTSSLCSSLPL